MLNFFFQSIVSADVALATLLGPILGGLISEKTSWRWVFLLKYSTTCDLEESS